MFDWIRHHIFLFHKTNKENAECDNVVESMVKAKALYRELIQKSHPDKHPDKIETAKELTELINCYRYNYKMLLTIKNKIESELLK